MNGFFEALDRMNCFIWSKLAFLFIVGLGAYFSFHSRFFQLRKVGSILYSFFFFLKKGTTRERGIHPLKAFFAAIGGMIGIGNVVGICTAVSLGGPGAVFWVWIGGFFGMLLQYAEVYLGVKYREENREHNYNGGPMYYLPAAFSSQICKRGAAYAVAFLLCAYGVEIFMFHVMTDSMVMNWNCDRKIVVAVLLVATLIVALGGIRRVGAVCGAMIPLFIFFYFGMCSWVLICHITVFPQVMREIFQGAFTAQAAQGAFAGCSVATAISMGISRGAYSGDIGIGYTSIIYAESQGKQIQRLASLAIVGIFLDTFVICTLSLFVILATGYWKSGVDPSLMVQGALALHFPYMHYFMPFFLFLLGYTTILAYFVVGIKCAKFLAPRWGAPVYSLCVSVILPLFAFIHVNRAFTIMSLVGALLLLLNCYGIFRLRKEVLFEGNL